MAQIRRWLRRGDDIVIGAVRPVIRTEPGSIAAVIGDATVGPVGATRRQGRISGPDRVVTASTGGHSSRGCGGGRTGHGGTGNGTCRHAGRSTPAAASPAADTPIVAVHDSRRVDVRSSIGASIIATAGGPVVVWPDRCPAVVIAGGVIATRAGAMPSVPVTRRAP